MIKTPEKKYCYIVENELSTAEILKQKLENNHFQVIGISITGEETLHRMETIHQRVDFMVMEIILGGTLTGIETAKIIMERFQIPVVYLTACTDESTLENALQSKPAALFFKPFSERELMINLSLCVTKRSSHQMISGAPLHSGVKKPMLIEQLKSTERVGIELQILVEQLQESVMITDLNGVIRYVNLTFINTYGYTREELIGENASILKSGKHTNKFYMQLWNTITSGGTFEGQLINKTKYQTLVFSQVKILALRDETGAINQYVLLGTDITHNRVIEHQNQEKNRLINEVFHLVPAIIFIYNLEKGVIEFVNSQLKKILGYEAHGLSIDDEFLESILIHAVQLDKVKSQLFMNSNRNNELHEKSFRIRVKRKDGQKVWLNLQSTIFDSDENGVPVRLLGVATDITQLKDNEKQLRIMIRLHEIMKKKEQKLRTLSLLQGQEKERKRVAREIHDNIGQLLTAVNLNLNGMQDLKFTSKDDRKGQNKLNKIRILLKNTINEVKRISNQLRPSTLEQFGLISAVRQMLEYMSGEEREIILESNIQQMRFDARIEQELFRIIQEATSNAIKFSESKIIRIRLQYKDSKLKVGIEDDGCGFNLADLPNDKTGNGLMNIRERATSIGAQLRIISDLQQGCHIQLELPIEVKKN